MARKTGRIGTRLAVVASAAAALTLATAPVSHAAVYNLGSFSGGEGWDSSRWTDEQYSEVYFDYCESNVGAPNESIEVELLYKGRK